MNLRIVTILCLFALLSGACTNGENQRILEAVQKYPLNGKPLDELIRSRVIELQSKGLHAEYYWVAPRVEQHQYDVVAVIDVKEKNLREDYVWALTEQPTGEKAHKALWTLKAKSEPAKAMGRGEKWAGFGMIR